MARRSEQAKELAKRIATRFAAVFVIYALAFAFVANLANAFIAPKVGNAVANALAPWEYVPAEKAVLSDAERVALEELQAELKADVVRSYLNVLANTCGSDSAWALAEDFERSKRVYDAMLVMQIDGKYGLFYKNGDSALGVSGVGNNGEGGEGDASSEDGEQSAASGNAAQPEEGGEEIIDEDVLALAYSQIDDSMTESQKQGLAQRDELDFSAYPDASEYARSLVGDAVDMRNVGKAVTVIDALWVLTHDLAERPDDVDALYDEASSALGYGFATDYRGESVYTTPNIERITYSDGHQLRRDLSDYNALKALKIPLFCAVYVIGVAIIACFAVRKSLGYFDALFGRMRRVLSKRDGEEDEPLPRELALAQEALSDIRRKNELDERAARAAEQRKNELVAYLAHDIKTPLTSITGYLSLLDEAPDMPLEQRKRYAGVALDKAYRLDGMIDEFFDISRYNLSALPIERERFDIALFCYQVAEEFEPSAAARGISIDVNASEGDEAFADARQLSRACSNVMKNAVAYADAGSTVTMGARIAEGVLEIEVRNHGREIAPEHLDRIFEQFYREDDARAARAGGAGLGLAIAREIVQAHGGSIEAKSEKGVTEFSIRIPCED